MNCTDESAVFMAEHILNLWIALSKRNPDSLQHSIEDIGDVHCKESLYMANEEEKLKAQFTVGFENESEEL